VTGAGPTAGAQQGFTQGGRCGRCGKSGHLTSQCPSQAAGAWMSARQGQGGASLGAAPPAQSYVAPLPPPYASAPVPSYASVPANSSSSFNAAFLNQAPSPPVPAAGGPAASGGGTCYRCGGAGHWANNCTLAGSGAGMGGGGGGGGGTGMHGGPSAGHSAASTRSSVGGGVEPVCPCNGLPFQRKTSQSSKNPGRDFFKCTACDAFHWVDAYDAGGGGSGGGTGVGGGGAYRTTGGGTYGMTAGGAGGGPGGECFKCGESGHWASQCTQPSDFGGQGTGGRGRGWRGRGRGRGRGGARGGRPAKRPRRGGGVKRESF